MSKIRPQQSDQGPNTRVYSVPEAPTATTGGDNRPNYYRALHMWATQHDAHQKCPQRGAARNTENIMIHYTSINRTTQM